jgi:molecular chaperone GrpE
MEKKADKKQEKAEQDKGREPKDGANVSVTAEELKELRDKALERDDYFQRYLRAHADFENARKRLEREKQEYFKYANSEIILELLSVLDVFKKAYDTACDKNDFEVLKNGVSMILKDAERFLKNHGVKKMEVMGEKFDTDLHEAVGFTERGDLPDGVITEQIKEGYMLNDRVIRPALVLVNKTDNEKIKEDD